MGCYPESLTNSSKTMSQIKIHLLKQIWISWIDLEEKDPSYNPIKMVITKTVSLRKPCLRL